jgi:threonine/homoserine/homoserine lactone efflux protein
MTAAFFHLGIVDPGLFLLAVLLLCVTPGPDTAFIVSRSLAQGARAGALSALGISLGCCLHCLLCAFGVTALIAASPGAFVIIKFGGALYLIFLGVRILISARRMVASANAVVALEPSRRREGVALVVQGFATNVANPKVILFFIAFFPQFVASDSPSKTFSLLLLGALFIVVATLYNVAVAWLSGSITRRIRAVPRFSLWLERGLGAAFIALGLRIALIRQPL